MAEAARVGNFEFKEGTRLTRWTKVDPSDMNDFLAPYQRSLETGTPHTEGYLFATTHYQKDSDLPFFSKGATVKYKVKYKEGGTEGRLVDKFKASAYEGEVLFPPFTQFQVTRIIEPSSKGKKRQYIIELDEI